MTLLEGYIGIDTLTEQIRKKALRQGFEFNVMVVGGSGLGKSTLINTLFKSKVSRRSFNKEEYVCPKTVEIKSISHVIEEKGIRLKLTVTDTPGFGDHINNQDCWTPITKYINEQYERYLSEEISIKRCKRIPDTRVHCCMYFIAPTGHSLRPIDIEAMKRLVKVVNVIPVIAKADSLTLEERETFKKTIQQELRQHDIEVFPNAEHEDVDDEEAENNKWLREKMPFAVVGATNSYTVGGKSVLGRKTSFGLIEVENEKHCEFSYLRNMIIRTHLQDLKDVTAQVHYESYRQKRLETIKSNPNHETNGTIIDLVTSTPTHVSSSSAQQASAKKSASPIVTSSPAGGNIVTAKPSPTSANSVPNKSPASQNAAPAKANAVAPNSAAAKPPTPNHVTPVGNKKVPASQPTKNGGSHRLAESKI